MAAAPLRGGVIHDFAALIACVTKDPAKTAL